NAAPAEAAKERVAQVTRLAGWRRPSSSTLPCPGPLSLGHGIPAVHVDRRGGVPRIPHEITSRDFPLFLREERKIVVLPEDRQDFLAVAFGPLERAEESEAW